MSEAREARKAAEAAREAWKAAEAEAAKAEKVEAATRYREKVSLWGRVNVVVSVEHTANNEVTKTLEDGTIVVVFYAVPIVVVYSSGMVVVSDGGWRTASTSRHINQALNRLGLGFRYKAAGPVVADSRKFYREDEDEWVIFPSGSLLIWPIG